MVALITAWWPRWVEFFALNWFVQAQGDDVSYPFVQETVAANLASLDEPGDGFAWPPVTDLVAPTTPVMSGEYMASVGRLREASETLGRSVQIADKLCEEDPQHSGYRRVLCCSEIDDARDLRAQIPDSLLGGERKAVRIEGFDVGASPREFLEPRAETLILSTTNGTRAILETAERCENVVLGSLLNLGALVQAAQGQDAVMVPNSTFTPFG